ncbi:MAG: GHKL domain-containing protein [Planctomycetes bacterium]|nr:GHKL domain-containing protein [Planctomycetota bacterium]
MDSRNRLHPVLRFSAFLFSALFVLLSLGLSLQLNVHSVAWLLALYVSAGLFISALRGLRASPIRGAYCFYLGMLVLYLFCVWLLHFSVPGPYPDLAKGHAAGWALVFYPGVICIPISHYHFARQFSESKSKVLLWIEYLGWAGTALFMGMLFTGHWVSDYFWAKYTWVPNLDQGYGQFFYFTSFYLTLSVAVPLYQIFITPNRKRRLQLIYYVVGAAPVWFMCWINFLISFGLDLYPAGGAFFILHAVIISYAVYKHKLFDVSIVIRKGLAYAGVSLCLGMLYGLLLCIPIFTNRSGLSDFEVLPSILFVVVAGFLAAPLLDLIQGMVDRLFFREWVDRQAIMSEFARQASVTLDLSAVARLLCHAVGRGLKTAHVKLYLCDALGSQPALYGQLNGEFRPAPWPEGVPLAPDVWKTAGASAAPYLVRPPAAEGSPPIQFGTPESALAIPIYFRQDLLGVLMADPKRADDPYEEGEMRWAEAMAAQAALALGNARSVEDLKTLQALQQRIFDSLTAGVILMDETGLILQANPSALRLLTDSGAQQAAGLRMGALACGPSSLAEVLLAFAQPGRKLTNQEVQIGVPRHADLLVSLRAIDARSDKQVFLAIFHDITEHKQMEALTRKQDSLAKVGEMIASINHEIKNLVQPIQYQVNVLSEDAFDKPDHRRFYGVIKARLAAIQHLLANLRDLARPMELRKQRIDLSKLALSVWREFEQHENFARIRFTSAFAPEAQFVHADGQLLMQVLYNLIKNAVETVGEVSAPAIRVHTGLQGRQVLLAVEDNGPGIEASSMARLFEPFFSTKRGSGTGLGLSICRKIIESHGGTLTAANGPGGGAVFVVALDAQREAALNEVHTAG